MLLLRLSVKIILCDFKNVLQQVHYVQVVPEVVGRVHALLAGDWDWSGADGKGGASEEARELADLQRSYYAFLNALAQNQLLQSLQVLALPDCSDLTPWGHAPGR